MTQSDKVMENYLKIEWPDDYILKVNFSRSKAQAMTDDIEVVSNSFTTGMQILYSQKSFTIRKLVCPTCQMRSNGKKVTSSSSFQIRDYNSQKYFFAYTNIYDFIPKWPGCMGVVHV